VAAGVNVRSEDEIVLVLIHFDGAMQIATFEAAFEDKGGVGWARREVLRRSGRETVRLEIIVCKGIAR
jgi:hypothetical protein